MELSEKEVLDITEAKKWQNIYLAVLAKYNARQEKFPSASQDKYLYLLKLAAHEDTSPLDTYAMATLLSEYPQIGLTVAVPFKKGKLALSMRQCVERRQKETDAAKFSGATLAETARTVKQKADSVVRQLAHKGLEEVGIDIFDKLQPLHPRPVSEEDLARQEWWGKIIPNIVVARELKQIALRREPSLAAATAKVQ